MKIFDFQLGQKEYTARPDMWGFRATGSPSRNLRFRDGVNFIQISPFRLGERGSYFSKPYSKTGKYPIPHAHLFGACLINYSLIRRRNNAPLSQAFTGGLPPLERRGANLRPRKLDGILSRHGLGARRVALLAPRATFSEYCSPLDYASAINKLFSRYVFIKAHRLRLYEKVSSAF